MNYEIKEIKINKANGSITFINNGIVFSQFGIAKEILDLVTNLQEQLHQASLDIQELTERDIECPSWCDKLTNLQEKYEEADNDRHKLFEQKEKAIEWVKKNMYYFPRPDELLNILQGENNE